jgi:hypothetical protein
VDVANDTVQFSEATVGKEEQKSFILYNKTAGSLTIESLDIIDNSGNIFRLVETPTLPFTLVAGKEKGVKITIACLPTKNADFTAKIRIKSPDADNVDKNKYYYIKLQSTHRAPEPASSCDEKLTVLPRRLDFGSVQFGCTTSKRQFKVFHPSSSECTSPILITRIGIANNKDNEFRIISAPTTPIAINTGQSIRIELSYKATDLGADIAILNIETNITGQGPITIPLEGKGISTNEQTDTFKQMKRPMKDVLFVIDDSSSMGEEQASLTKNLQSFMNWAVRLNVDYHIAVTTTDTSQTGARAPGCIRGTTHKVVTQKIPNPIATFANNINVGTNGSSLEQGLEAAYQAFQPKALAGCNKGFYRKNAALEVIIVSDEPDQSPQTVQFYVSFFKALKGIRNLDLIRASAVVGPPPSGCRNPGTGHALSTTRYWEVAKQLKGVKESICFSNWAGTLSNLGSLIFWHPITFLLSRQADPKTIRVKVNGRPIKEDPQDGWTYELTNNSINFTKSQIPPPGATIQVDYKTICLP